MLKLKHYKTMTNYNVLRRLTLTKPQELYVRENYNRMPATTMAANLNVHASVITRNMVFMGLKRAGRPPKQSVKVLEGFFDEVEYAKTAII